VTLRVVLYVEGGRESGGDERSPVEPGVIIPEASLGSAHFLVRRTIEHARRIPEAAIHFECPLRTTRGKLAKGSDFLNRQTLRQLLTWPSAKRRPDMAIVLHDMDGDTNRLTTLRGHTENLRSRPVIGVAREEFEAWLLADVRTLHSVCKQTVKMPPSPEQLERSEAKKRIEQWIANDAGTNVERRSKRIEIARTCDIGVVRDRCPSFNAFYEGLRDWDV
jgi:hypothetical protein